MTRFFKVFFRFFQAAGSGFPQQGRPWTCSQRGSALAAQDFYLRRPWHRAAMVGISSNPRPFSGPSFNSERFISRVLNRGQAHQCCPPFHESRCYCFLRLLHLKASHKAGPWITPKITIASATAAGANFNQGNRLPPPINSRTSRFCHCGLELPIA